MRKEKDRPEAALQNQSGQTIKQGDSTTPRLPHIGTMHSRALARLLAGRKIDHHQFQNETGSYRLSRDIHVLGVRYGWRIERAEYQRAVRDGQRIAMRSFARYWLSPESIAAIGPRGCAFVDAVAQFEKRAAA